jgi:hypothetical protein
MNNSDWFDRIRNISFSDKGNFLSICLSEIVIAAIYPTIYLLLITLFKYFYNFSSNFTNSSQCYSAKNDQLILNVNKLRNI